MSYIPVSSQDWEISGAPLEVSTKLCCSYSHNETKPFQITTLVPSAVASVYVCLLPTNSKMILHLLVE